MLKNRYAKVGVGGSDLVCVCACVCACMCVCLCVWCVCCVCVRGWGTGGGARGFCVWMVESRLLTIGGCSVPISSVKVGCEVEESLP